MGNINKHKNTHTTPRPTFGPAAIKTNARARLIPFMPANHWRRHPRENRHWMRGVARTTRTTTTTTVVSCCCSTELHCDLNNPCVWFPNIIFADLTFVRTVWAQRKRGNDNHHQHYPNPSASQPKAHTHTPRYQKSHLANINSAIPGGRLRRSRRRRHTHTHTVAHTTSFPAGRCHAHLNVPAHTHILLLWCAQFYTLSFAHTRARSHSHNVQ